MIKCTEVYWFQLVDLVRMHMVIVVGFLFFFEWYGDHRDLHSFPTRRSSDLETIGAACPAGKLLAVEAARSAVAHPDQDRKSTRLNSSHRCISYAVFCLKKKKTTSPDILTPCRSSDDQPCSSRADTSLLNSSQ